MALNQTITYLKAKNEIDFIDEEEPREKEEKQKETEKHKEITLICSKCKQAIECGEDYFGQSLFLAPHHTDNSYAFSCKACVSLPILKHLTKQWADVALCALTTLEMVMGWYLFCSNDLEAFVESHLAEMASNYKELQTHQWREIMHQEIAKCAAIHKQTKDGTLLYGILHRGIPPSKRADQYYVPNKIIAKNENETHFKVEWKYFAPGYATWEPRHSLLNCDILALSHNAVIENYNSESEDDYTPENERRSRSKRRKLSTEATTRSVNAISTAEKRSLLEKSTTPRTRPSLHHKYQVCCSTCNVLVPVTELGCTIISPTCTGWTLRCSHCDKGGKNVVEYGKNRTPPEQTLRALFSLHVKSPLSRRFDIKQLGKEITDNPQSYPMKAKDLTRYLRQQLSKGGETVLTLFSGSGRYKYRYIPSNNDGNSDEYKSKEKSNDSDTKEKQKGKEEVPQQIRKEKKEKQKSNDKKEEQPPSSPTPPTNKPQGQIPQPSPQTFTPPPPFFPQYQPPHLFPQSPQAQSPQSLPQSPIYQYGAFSQYPYTPQIFYPSQFNPSAYPGGPPIPPISPLSHQQSSLQPPFQPPFTTVQLQGLQQSNNFATEDSSDLHIYWLGEEEAFTYLNTSLDISLSELRTKFLRGIAETDPFVFHCKGSPIHTSLEPLMKVRQCVTKGEEGYYLKLKREESKK